MIDVSTEFAENCYARSRRDDWRAASQENGRWLNRSWRERDQ
jgi:hypothetical protein